MTTGELINTKFNTTKKFKLYNREKDRKFLKITSIVGGIGIIGFLLGRTFKL